MFAPFTEPAAGLTLPPPRHDVPWDEVLDLDRRLGIQYPDLPK